MRKTWEPKLAKHQITPRERWWTAKNVKRPRFFKGQVMELHCLVEESRYKLRRGLHEGDQLSITRATLDVISLCSIYGGKSYGMFGSPNELWFGRTYGRF